MPALRSILNKGNAAAEDPSVRTDDEEHFGEAGSIAVGAETDAVFVADSPAR